MSDKLQQAGQIWRQINNLTLDNFGVAPRWFKGLVLITCSASIMAFGWLLLIKPMMLGYESLSVQEQTLVGEYAQKYAKAKQLQAVNAQTLMLNRDLAGLIETLPHRLNASLVIEQLHAAAIRTGVQIVDVKTQSETESALFFERGMTIVIEGSYHKIGKLLAQFAALPMALTFHDFDIQKLSQSGNQTKLRLTLYAKIYRAKPIDKNANKGASDD